MQNLSKICFGGARKFYFDDAPFRATRNTLFELTKTGARVPLVKGERNVREAPTSSSELLEVMVGPL